MEKNVFTVKQLAKYLALHPITIYNYIKKNKIPAFRIGRSWRFNKESIDRWRMDKEKENKAQLRRGNLA